MIRTLICLANASISGGSKIMLEFGRSLQKAGQHVDVYVWNRRNQPLDWFPPEFPIVEEQDLKKVVGDNYDMVLFVKAFLVPLALPYMGKAKPVFVCQDYEGFYLGATFASMVAECTAFDHVLRLPISIICTSKPVGKMLFERLNLETFSVPIAIDKELFRPGSVKERASERPRVLMVGDHLLPSKGIQDGIKALNLVEQDTPIELVLITRQPLGLALFRDLPYPCDVHVRPAQEEVPDIYASCDLFCCPSWYEGFGLPALEAFSIGIPVVSTKNSGVTNYGIDGFNLLLCEPNDPLDLSIKLKEVISDAGLADRLCRNGKVTLENFDWSHTAEELLRSQRAILSTVGESPLVTVDQATALLSDLESAGLYTPLAVHEKCERLFDSLQSVMDNLQSGSPSDRDELGTLKEIRDELEPLLGNERAEYYRACKKRFDLCQLVLGFANDDAFPRVLSSGVARAGNMHLPCCTMNNDES